MVPRHADSHLLEWASMSYVVETLEAGVKIRLYEPGFNHSKMLACDDELCTCGSTNIDFRSFENNFEANVFIYDRPTTLRMKQLYLDDEAKSVDFNEVEELCHRPYLHRLMESMFRMLSPLL